MRSAVLCLALTVSVVVAEEHRTILEARQAPPLYWSRLDRVNPSKTVELSFFLKTPLAKAKTLERELLLRSSPASPLYGQWLSNNQVHELASPEEGGLEAVTDFLASHGLKATARTPNSDALSVVTTYAEAEALLNATYHVHRHQHLEVARCLSYSLPGEVAAHIAFVGPTTHFPLPRTPKVSPDPELPNADGASYSNDPANLRALYGVGGAVGGLARQAVTAFLGQYYRAVDLASFFETYFPAGENTPIELVGDATEGLPAGVEAMLDIEYMPAMGALNPTGFWGFSGASPEDAADEPFLSWLLTVSNTSDNTVPLVFSTSYGEDETAEVPSAYADRINVEFVKCGLRGISLLFASGDSGAASDSGTCPNGQFMPMWPAGSPFVTAVGGATNGALPESAWSGSSGGFSNAFAQPEWQAGAVATFLSTASAAGSLPDSSYFDAKGRGFPDIAAQSVNFPVVANGVTLGSVAGTSCASPTASGVFGLLNHARLAANKTSLGFLNPLLYANPSALNDVALGVQGGCSIGGGPVAGFPAVVGWDAVTGLGSPNYPALLEVVLALP